MMRGFRLDDIGSRLSWADAHAVLMAEARTPGTPLSRAVNPEGYMWSHVALMLRRIEYTTALLAWMWQGDEDAPAPEPIPVPWESDGQRVDDARPIDIDEMEEWLAGRRQAEA